MNNRKNKNPSKKQYHGKKGNKNRRKEEMSKTNKAVQQQSDRKEIGLFVEMLHSIMETP